jgi:small subunit ribosomal protein S8
MRHDILADALSALKNARSKGKKTCLVRPIGKLLIEVLKVMQKNDYIGAFEVMPNPQGGEIKIEIKERLNNCNAIKPRFYVKKGDILKYEKRFLPSREIGIIILTTSKGVMDNKEAKKKGLGGVLLAFAY